MERPAEVSPGLWLFPRIMACVLSLPLHSARGLARLTNCGSPPSSAFRGNLYHQPPLRLLGLTAPPRSPTNLCSWSSQATYSWTKATASVPTCVSTIPPGAPPTGSCCFPNALDCSFLDSFPTSLFWLCQWGPSQLHMVGWWEDPGAVKWTLFLGGSGDLHCGKGPQDILMLAERPGECGGNTLKTVSCTCK